MTGPSKNTIVARVGAVSCVVSGCQVQAQTENLSPIRPSSCTHEEEVTVFYYLKKKNNRSGTDGKLHLHALHIPMASVLALNCTLQGPSARGLFLISRINSRLRNGGALALLAGSTRGLHLAGRRPSIALVGGIFSGGVADASADDGEPAAANQRPAGAHQ